MRTAVVHDAPGRPVEWLEFQREALENVRRAAAEFNAVKRLSSSERDVRISQAELRLTRSRKAAAENLERVDNVERAARDTLVVLGLSPTARVEMLPAADGQTADRLMGEVENASRWLNRAADSLRRFRQARTLLRTRLGGVAAVFAVISVGVLVAYVWRQSLNAPFTNSNSTVAATRPPSVAVATLLNAVSRYSGSYYAQLNRVVRDGTGISTEFNAEGASDLRTPDTSCLRFGGQTIRQDSMALTVNQTGRYQGTLHFPFLGAGTYEFVYSCQDDYSPARFRFD